MLLDLYSNQLAFSYSLALRYSHYHTQSSDRKWLFGGTSKNCYQFVTLVEGTTGFCRLTLQHFSETLQCALMQFVGSMCATWLHLASCTAFKL